MLKSTSCLVILAGISATYLLGQAPVVEIQDPAWEKTENSVIGGAYGAPALLVTDTYWNFTSQVWDGPPVNGNGESIPGFVPGDFWATWPHEEGIEQRWFKATVDVCDTSILTRVRVVNKYCPGCSEIDPTMDILSINDDLYVYVNGSPARAGGVAGAFSLPIDSPFTDIYDVAHRSQHNTSALAVETGWHIDGGLALTTALFVRGKNEIAVLADESAGWGGVGHLIFKLEQDRACKINVQIDVKPGSYPNCFNVTGHGVIPVAIFGSPTFNIFDLDPITLEFAGLKVKVRGKGTPMCGLDDVNGDGRMDIVCHFADDPALWSGGADTALVTGNLFDGTPIQGSDSICVVPE